MDVAHKLKELMEKVPGYSGYARREERRNADKELRDATAAAFSSQVTRITRVQEQMLTRGDFDNLEVLDQIITRLQHLADRIRTASYGFTGLFDDDVVDEAVLDRLYAFDLELANGIEQTADLIARIGSGSDANAAIAALRQKIDDLHETFSQRSYLINTFPAQRDESSESSGTIPETPVEPPEAGP